MRMSTLTAVGSLMPGMGSCVRRGVDVVTDAVWVITLLTLLLSDYVRTAQAIQYYLHHHCNRTVALGPNEVGQVRITNEMPDKLFRARHSIGDCEVEFTTAFPDEHIRLRQRPVDVTRYETGTITVVDADSNVDFPVTSTSGKVTIRFETDDVINIFAVEVTIDFAVVGDPWLLQDQVAVNRSFLISILVLIIVLQLVILVKLCRADRRHAAGDDDGSGGESKKSKGGKDKNEKGKAKGSMLPGGKRPSSPTSAALKRKLDSYTAPKGSPSLNRLPPMDNRNKRAAMGDHEDKEDNYYIK